MTRAKPAKGFTYAEAGVDVEAVRAAHRALAKAFATGRGRKPEAVGRTLSGPGHYAGLVRLWGGKALALHVDGVGTKVLVAEAADRFDTVGVDCVAMNVNDIICVGAKPLAFADYLVLKRTDEELVKEIAKGLAKGARQASVPIVGGETAVMPDLLGGEGDKVFDLAGMAVGLVNEKRIIRGESIGVGDVVIGVESSGLHSNGYTLARKVLLERYSLDTVIPELGRSLAGELLEPTRIYARPVLELLRKRVEVHGLAHVTGGAYTKLRRLIEGRPLGFRLDRMPRPPPIFNLIQRTGKVATREMYRTFNMGVGFCVVAPKSDAGLCISAFERHRIRAQPIGEIIGARGVYVKGLRVD